MSNKLRGLLLGLVALFALTACQPLDGGKHPGSIPIASDDRVYVFSADFTDGTHHRPIALYFAIVTPEGTRPYGDAEIYPDTQGPQGTPWEYRLAVSADHHGPLRVTFMFSPYVEGGDYDDEHGTEDLVGVVPKGWKLSCQIIQRGAARPIFAASFGPATRDAQHDLECDGPNNTLVINT